MKIQQPTMLLLVVALMSHTAYSQVVKSDAPKPRPKTADAKAVEPKLGPPKVPSKPGLWQTTIKSALDTGGSGEGQALACVSPKDLRNVESLLPRYAEVGMSCSNTNLKLNGVNATWRVSCTSKTGASVEGTGKLMFSAETQSGTGALIRKAAGKTTNIKQKIDAKLIGAC